MVDRVEQCMEVDRFLAREPRCGLGVESREVKSRLTPGHDAGSALAASAFRGSEFCVHVL